jgi:catechol 2,3-dioxygenase-like lactoylglutathione lyase family enzyme
MADQAFEIRALHHVQLAAPAGCEDEARRFYGELLGLTEVPKPATLAGRGGVWFSLDGRPDGQGLHIGVEQPFTAARKAHPALQVHNLEALAERLSTAGVTVVWDDDLPGYRRFYAFDPWGNRLELLTPAD